LQEALYVLFGPLLSVSAINRVTRTVQETMNSWYQRPIEQTPPIILVDGVWVKILYPTGAMWLDRASHEREERRVEERVILAALAVWPDGHYHILHYEVADTEDESSWRAFWQHMIARGLDPQAVELVVSDGTKGLLGAMKVHLPKARLQRCTVHKVRGFAQYLSYQDLPERDADTGQPLTEAEAKVQRRLQISTDALDIFQAPTRAMAEQRLEAFIEKW
jgi:transposase-like protein